MSTSTRREAPVAEFYDYDVPEYVVSAGLSYLTIRLSYMPWSDPEPLKISVKTICDDVDNCGTMWKVGPAVLDWRTARNLINEVARYILCANPRMTKRQREIVTAAAEMCG